MLRSLSRSAIGPRHNVIVYPNFAVPMGDDSWGLRIHGCVYEPGVVNFRKRMMLRLLQRVLRAAPEDLQSPIFQQRIAGFVAAPERGRQVTVRVGQNAIPIRKKSKRNGQFSAVVRLSHDLVQQAHPELTEGDWLTVRVDTHPDDNRELMGRVQLLPARGLSVISDIDDTIKHTQVSSRRAMLTNTFLKEFAPVEGMAERYRRWQADGAAFHYVSSSPWQLFEPLLGLCEQYGFPNGSIHLRSFCLRDHMLRRLLLIRRSGKAKTIDGILSSFPRRRFVLVGDSGEKDPEIYARLARKHPQVESIWIREVPEHPMNAARRQRVFSRVADHRWQIFRDSDELPETIAPHACS